MPDSREELKQLLSAPDSRQELRELLAEPESGSSALGSFLVNLLKGTGDAALAIPSASGDLLAMAAAGVEGTARGLVPGGEGFEFRERFREEQDKFPASAIRSIPRPTTNDVIAAGRAGLSPLLGGPEDAFSGELERLNESDRQRAEEHPLASALGDFGGTVASLLIAKKPIQGNIRSIENRIMNPAAATKAPTKLADDLDRAFRSKFVRLPARGLFRAGEAGLEAAFLEVLSESENDPVLAAGLGAGAQVASSNFFGGLKSFVKGGPGAALGNFTASAIAMGGLWQMVKSATPGGEDDIIKSIESGFDKTTYAVLLGVLGSAMGARGRNANVSEPMQNIIEGFTTLPRTKILNVITDFADAPEQEQELFGNTLDKVIADPSFKGATEKQKQLVKKIREALE